MTVRPRLERAFVAVARQLARRSPLEPWPGWQFGAAPRGARAATRKAVWKIGQVARVQTPVLVPWHNGLLMEQRLGSDVSRCLYVGGAYEPNELCFLADALGPGSVFIDVGANEGLFSCLASTVVRGDGRVLAVEPSRREREALERNVQRNRLTNVTVVPFAVDSEAGVVSLRVADPRHAGHNTIGAFAYGDVATAVIEDVPALTLDELVDREGLTRVDLIKIDIEGSELRALQGAVRTLEERRPFLLLEVQETSLRSLGGSREELLRLLEAHRYVVAPFGPTDGRPAPGRRITDEDLNVAAIPQELVR